MEELARHYAHIKGWGVDADPKNDPTYPMKNRNNGEHKGYTWKRPSQQPLRTEVLRSIERPNITAVYGTSTPPAGLSGMIRRKAFTYSESSYGHWLPLMLADRVNAAEGILGDLKHGHLPNILAERGWKAEWKHNKKRLVQRAFFGAVFVSAALAYLSRKRGASYREE